MRIAPLLLAMLIVAPPSSAAAAHLFALEHVNVVDVARGTVERDRVVMIRGDRIIEVTDAAGGVGRPDVRRLALPGRFVVPGLIDMHAHVLLHPWGSDGRIVPNADAAATRWMLRSLLAEGVTTVRDPGDPAADAVALRRDLERGRLQGPRLFVAGEMLQADAMDVAPFLDVRSEAEVRAAVRRLAAQGVDWIKLYSRIPPAWVRATVEEAHARGLRVTGHLQRTDWSEAAAAGIDGVEHLASWSPFLLPGPARAAYTQDLFGRVYWLENVAIDGAAMDSMLSALVEHRVTVDPTLIAMHSKFWGDDTSYTRPARSDLVPPIFLRGWPAGSFTAAWTAAQYVRARATWPRAQALVRRMRDAGVRLVVGTDTPTPWIVPGESVHREMELLVEAGLTPAEVLRMATMNAADALGQGRELGRIAPGMRADLLVLSADPIRDVRALRAIEWLIARGVPRRPAEVLEGNRGVAPTSAPSGSRLSRRGRAMRAPVRPSDGGVVVVSSLRPWAPGVPESFHVRRRR